MWSLQNYFWTYSVSLDLPAFNSTARIKGGISRLVDLEGAEPHNVLFFSILLETI